MKFQIRRVHRLVPPQNLGTIAEVDDVPIIRSNALNIQKGLPQAVPLGRLGRLDPRTVEAKTPAPAMIRLPEALSREVSAMTMRCSPQLLRQRVSGMYKRLQNGEPHRPTLESIDVEAHVTGAFLQNYATISAILAELKKRLPKYEPESILDIGFGPATGLLAARELWPGLNREVAVVLGHPRMKRTAKQLLASQADRSLDQETVILRQEVPTHRSPGRYDLIIATHQLYRPGPYSKEVADSHAQQMASLLAPEGVLVMVERGDPLGFESIARAREVLVRTESTQVVAPCSHSKSCPLQQGLFSRQAARSPAAQNWCRFSQSVQRPKFSLELKKGQYLSQPWTEVGEKEEWARGRGGKALAGTGRPAGNSHEVANYSYVVLQVGTSATLTDTAVPRILKQPLKRDGHVLMEVCAPTGRIEHWTVPRSQSKQAYYDARKANAGDLWALDAKTKQNRGGLKHAPSGDDLQRPDTHQNKKPADWWSSTPPGDSDGSFLESIVDLSEFAEREQKLSSRERQHVYRKL